MKPLCFACLLLLLLLPACSTPPAARSFPDGSALTPRAAMPDPLVMLDGQRVTSPSQWFKERRPELKALFQHYMYGSLPPAPEQVRGRLLGQYADFLEGRATLKLLSLEMSSFSQTSRTNAPCIDLLLVVPNERVGPAPVFLAMDFCGNQALTIIQNCLVALCAPRPVLFTAAEQDQWANPAGQFEVLRAADPVYRFLGSAGLAVKELPPQRRLVDSPLGYYVREGKHSMTADDWRVFMDFADRQFGTRQKAGRGLTRP